MNSDVPRIILRNATNPFGDYCQSNIIVERIDLLRINPSDHFTGGETETIFQPHFDADWMKCNVEPRRERGEERGLYN